MKITRFIILSMLLCLMFQFSAYAEDTEKAADPLGDAQIAYAAKDYKKAVKLLEPLAKEGNIRAKTLLAPLIIKGAGTDKDLNRGLKMIMEAAEGGDADARKIAIDYNHELAKQGDASAMFNMGFMCLKGWAGEMESSSCIALLENAASVGHAQSAKFLAYIYKNGKYGIPADQTKADEWNNYTPPPAQ